MPAPRRVLIDWDFAAHGIWWVLSAEELSAPAAGGTWISHDPRVDRPWPWSDRLSAELLDALQDWNESGEMLFGPHGTPTAGPELDAFYARAAALAQRTQRELGHGHEVLYVTPCGAWRWVDPPFQR